MGRFERERPGLAVLALGADAVVTDQLALADGAHVDAGAPGADARRAGRPAAACSTPRANTRRCWRRCEAAHAKDMAVIALTGRSRRRAARRAGRNRRGDHRAARPHRTRAGDASADPALPVRRDRSSIAGRTGPRMTRTQLKPSIGARAPRALAWRWPLTQLRGCAPLLVGGAMVGGTMMVSDRRTTGTQVEDQAIELKASNRMKRGDRRPRARQRHQLQPHRAAHRRGAPPRPTRPPSSRRCSGSRTCAPPSTSWR